MKKINKPESQLQEVLYYLIKRLNVDRRQMMLSVGILNLPELIRILRHRYGLNIALSEIKTVNKFGRETTYGKYSISNKIEARNLYNKLQLKNKTK